MAVTPTTPISTAVAQAVRTVEEIASGVREAVTSVASSIGDSQGLKTIAGSLKRGAGINRFGSVDQAKAQVAGVNHRAIAKHLSGLPKEVGGTALAQLVRIAAKNEGIS